MGDTPAGEPGYRAEAEMNDTWQEGIRSCVAALERLSNELRSEVESEDTDRAVSVLEKRREVLDQLGQLTGAARMEAADAGDAGGGWNHPLPGEVARAVERINQVDQESCRMLREQLEATTAELEKLRMGRNWREAFPA